MSNTRHFFPLRGGFFTSIWSLYMKNGFSRKDIKVWVCLRCQFDFVVSFCFLPIEMASQFLDCNRNPNHSTPFPFFFVSFFMKRKSFKSNLFYLHARGSTNLLASGVPRSSLFQSYNWNWKKIEPIIRILVPTFKSKSLTKVFWISSTIFHSFYTSSVAGFPLCFKFNNFCFSGRTLVISDNLPLETKHSHCAVGFDLENRPILLFHFEWNSNKRRLQTNTLVHSTDTPHTPPPPLSNLHHLLSPLHLWVMVRVGDLNRRCPTNDGFASLHKHDWKSLCQWIENR